MNGETMERPAPDPAALTGAVTEEPEEKRFYTIEELYDANLPPVEGFLADVVFARQTVSVIAGRRSVGKTYLVLALARAIASGDPLGHLPTRRGRVLFFSEEMTAGQVKGRLRKLLGPENKGRYGTSIQIACKEGVRLDTDEGAEWLRVLIESAGGVDVVFIDALRDVKGSAQENDNDGMGALFGRLRDLVAVPLKCAIVMLHHKGKPSDAGTERGGRGASAIEDVAADVIYIDIKEGGTRVGTFAKVREGAVPPFTYAIEDAEQPGRVELVVGPGDGEANEMEARARKAADYVGEKGEVLALDVERHFGWSRTTTGRALNDAARKEWICKADHKGGENGKATIWTPNWPGPNVVN